MDATTTPPSHRDAHLEASLDTSTLRGLGLWSMGHLTTIENEMRAFIKKAPSNITLDMKEIRNFDSAGAIILSRILTLSRKKKKHLTITGLEKRYQLLLDSTFECININDKIPEIRPIKNPFYYFGALMIQEITLFLGVFSFAGEIIMSTLYTIRHPLFFTWRSVLSVFQSNCYRAMPIVALLNFLVGLVLTYQMSLELVSYGMNLYIVNISSLVVLREFGALITAIIAAGRTSTSFSAQIGTMIVNDEIDALKTMGVRPLELLVLPKMLGILIALPLLTVWADFFGMLGAMIIAKVEAGIDFYTFIERFQEVVPISFFILGISKTPVFALIITIVGCFQGFQAQKNANSVGRRTTNSAVQSLFLIIIADSLFSVLFSWKSM
ncbi:MAG: hypothetical protein A3F10_04230 [Coxiella sp. RIFCSPHIGHO2_12_FULL_42_15]|nr:MAG: hypothetical protein A3F10_04230 [Coxiella sp. RIFCSPHIGHO2_12_FULL_42_15]